MNINNIWRGSSVPKRFFIICLNLLLVYTGAFAAQPLPREYQLKAVFLNGFTKFIVWPDHVFAKTVTPLRICVLGEHPFGKALDIAVANTNRRRRKGRQIEVRYINIIDQVPGCHTLYVSKSEQYRQALILDYVVRYPVLTVSDIDNFVINGGMIQFYVLHNKVRFLIAPQTIRYVGLEAHGNLLRIADVVSSNNR